MIRNIINFLLSKWHVFLLLLLSAVVVYTISLIVGFFVANRYQSDYLGILIMKSVFAIVTPTPLLILWRDITIESKSRIGSLLLCSILHLSMIGVCWIIISSL